MQGALLPATADSKAPPRVCSLHMQQQGSHVGQHRAPEHKARAWLHPAMTAMSVLCHGCASPVRVPNWVLLHVECLPFLCLLYARVHLLHQPSLLRQGCASSCVPFARLATAALCLHNGMRARGQGEHPGPLGQKCRKIWRSPKGPCRDAMAAWLEPNLRLQAGSTRALPPAPSPKEAGAVI